MKKRSLLKFQVEPEYRLKLDKVKKDFLSSSLSDLIERIKAWKKMKDQAEEELSTANLHLEAISEIVEYKMDELQIRNFKTEKGETVYISSTAYPKVEDKAALFAWIKKKKMVEILGVNFQTLKGICNDLLKEGEELPPGVECFIKSSVRMRKGENNG
jgi:hypothetical protein